MIVLLSDLERMGFGRCEWWEWGWHMEPPARLAERIQLEIEMQEDWERERREAYEELEREAMQAEYLRELEEAHRPRRRSGLPPLGDDGYPESIFDPRWAD